MRQFWEQGILEFPFKDNNLKLRVKQRRENHINGDIGGVFFREDYKWLNPKDNVVIDIGANIGDSSIYFALEDALKVIALEPYIYSYVMAEENVEINDLKSKIELLNAGYGKDSEVIVDDKETSAKSDLRLADRGVKIKIYSLKTIFEKYNIKNALLKMDCEGCEYNLLDEENETLGKLSRIQIEYHYGYERLKEKLENAGFNVSYTEPKKVYNENARETDMYIGNIYAEK